MVRPCGDVRAFHDDRRQLVNGWTFHNPVQIHFGERVLDSIAAVLRGQSYLLITHPDQALQPWRARIVELCGQPMLTVDDIQPNPSLETLKNQAMRISGIGAEPAALVALGGGSVIDSAKFLAASRGRADHIMPYAECGADPSPPALPIIAIPTTSGTGSDLTKWATVWDRAQDRKISLERDDIFPEATLIDPLLTRTMPWATTLASGLDALSHALESIWNNNANPLTRDFAVRAARIILAALIRLKGNPADGEARKRMAFGATCAGLAFSNTRTALAHNISYPITLRYQVAHGIACSFCLPEVMQAAIGVSPECDDALMQIFGTLPDAPAQLRTFLDTLEVPATPHALGIAPEEWSVIVRDAFDGVRGRNFIGSADHFPEEAIRSPAAT